ncbi:MAG TPA: hypothetical protein VIK16_07740, partial [Candidatus Limnocylindrales bacterium]
MHEPGRPSSRPNPTRLLALGGILLVVAACGQSVVATSTAAPASAAAQAAATLPLPADGTPQPPGV